MRVLLLALILALRGDRVEITEEQARLMELPKFPEQMYGIVHLGCQQHGCVIRERKKLPLKQIKVSVETQGLIAHVETEFKYKNFSNDVIRDTEFVFPLDSKAAVYSLFVKCGDDEIDAKIEEKRKAKKVYDNAVRSGHTATHMEQNSKMPDVFKFSLGNIAINAECVATFKYVQEMYKYNFDGLNTLFFRYPVELLHRYGDKSGVTDQARNKEYDFDFKFKVNEKDSETKVIETDERLNVDEDRKSLVFIKKENFTKDVDIFITTAEDRPIAILEHGKESKKEEHEKPKGWFNWLWGTKSEGSEFKENSVLMVNFNPKFNTESVAEQEFVMVLDRSGSMRGDRETTAKETVLEWIERLPTTDLKWEHFSEKKTCTFNIVSFGSNYEKWQKGSVKCTKENKEKAKQHVRGFESDMGGTELLQCLKEVLKSGNEKEMKQVFLVTDGAVSDAHSVIEVARKYKDSSRIFSFGIGHGASSELVIGVAQANGMSYMIPDNEIDFLKNAVGHALTNAKSEYFTDVEVRVNGKDNERMTKIPFGLFRGVPFSVYAQVPSTMSEKNVEVKMMAKNAKGERVEFPPVLAQVAIQEDSEKLPVHRLAAKKFISEWVTGDDIVLYKPDRTLTELGEKVLSVSKSMSIVSEVSSFVGIGRNVIDIDVDDGFEQREKCVAAPKNCANRSYNGPKMQCAAPQRKYADVQYESVPESCSHEVDGDEVDGCAYQRADERVERKSSPANKKSQEESNENSSNAFSVFFLLYILVLFL